MFICLGATGCTSDNMENIDINEFRRNIAVVPQNTILFAGKVAKM